MNKPEDALPHGLTEADLKEIVEVFRILLRWDVELKASASSARAVPADPCRRVLIGRQPKRDY